jgi:hypothetical protein
MDAFVVAQTLLNDFEARVRLVILTANDPFLFYTGVGKEFYTGAMAWSLKGFSEALENVDVKAVEFHVRNGDFGSWVENSLRDQTLASEIKNLAKADEKGEKLRTDILDLTKKRFATLSKQTQEVTQLF